MNNIEYTVSADAVWGEPPNETTLNKELTINLPVTDELYVQVLYPDPEGVTVLWRPEQEYPEQIKVTLRYPGGGFGVSKLYDKDVVNATINGEPVRFTRRGGYFTAPYDLDKLCCGEANLSIVFGVNPFLRTTS